MHRLYFLEGDLSAEIVKQLSQQLLADPVTETYTVGSAVSYEPQIPSGYAHFIEVTLLPGVTDPAAENLIRAAHLLGVTGLRRAATGQRYLLAATLSRVELEARAKDVANAVIQRFAIDQPIVPPFVAFQAADATVELFLCVMLMTRS